MLSPEATAAATCFCCHAEIQAKKYNLMRQTRSLCKIMRKQGAPSLSSSVDCGWNVSYLFKRNIA
jgi:hypothetical protein